ncbi:uncharacterized protein J7T54_006689 [Emericellopsis cladophorae]|uniref:NB-ARC domain-containing protein n=1 Tax=Emericellopsis cladophorae TaxID=2686198 RepID=A0A9P9Y7S0_9HYPO|nr:uncharacterized protein J7T54_006689 [Emericellopsis cladophorae]KAI6784643.1 hypothetical protein J7T54_006689 [Emericellopsis cladophorae]
MVEKLSRSPSPLWLQALEKYREELQAADDYQAIQKVHTLEELIDSFSSFHGAVPNTHAGVISLHKIAPRLKFVDDFSAVLALCFGANTALTAAVWGSIRMILSHASAAAETLKDVLDMLEELSLTLPRLQVYEQTVPLNRSLQQALLDVYSEIICFYARAIHFLRSNPNLVLRKNAWQTFRDDFSRTNMRIKRMSTSVESEADLARMRKDETQYKEVLELLHTMKAKTLDEPERIWYNNIPFAANTKFSGRQDILNAVGKALVPETTTSTLKSIALFGLGGVGKTQIATQYAYQNMNNFDIILWVAADNAISIAQSFRTIAEGLDLVGSGEELKDAAVSIYKVKSWLATTDSTYLIIFDNADDLTALKTAWPATSRGSVLLTTRDFTVATSLLTQYVQVDALDDRDGSELLLKALDLETISPDDKENALAINKAFGGLPLALAQLTGVSIHLLNLLAFFEPDGISEDILLQGSKDIDGEFSFLSDEMDLGDASEDLLRAALVNRAGESGVLSIHRLVQSAAQKRLDESESMRYFDAVVYMLCWGFPDHSSTDIGHQIAAWTQCEKCLLHVNHLVHLVNSQGKAPGNRQKYADLLLRCSWYLYESEMYNVARTMVEQAISIFRDKTGLDYASAIDLGGLIVLDLAQPAQALKSFMRALEIRKAVLGPEDPFVAYSLNNVALAYTEIGELELAYAAHQEAIRLRLAAKSDRIVLGNKLKTCDSQYDVACMLLKEGHENSAIQLLEEVVNMTETFAEGDGQRARALYKLAEIYSDRDIQAESIACRGKASTLREALRPDLKDAPFEEAEFSKLCLWMLW